ncbi:MAG: prophage tail fiber N-terminal domain-containing protein [Scandinavium sp.]|uniref:prophage tail fiber N-terminal domain-containing protein n=1 Tax=Scandinavium sp. TaxID=2830653 RepID=UPI003F2C399E
MITLSGIYQRPDGEIVPGAVISFIQLGNTANSFTHLKAEMTTGDDGAYSISLYDGLYKVEARYTDRRVDYLGNITITAESEDGTLNDYLTLSSCLPNNAILDAMQQVYFANKDLVASGVKTVAHISDIPGDASGYYYVTNDEDKGAPTLYLFTAGQRVWLASVDDTP